MSPKPKNYPVVNPEENNSIETKKQRRARERRFLSDVRSLTPEQITHREEHNRRNLREIPRSVRSSMAKDAIERSQRDE